MCPTSMLLALTVVTDGSSEPGVRGNGLHSSGKRESRRR